MENKPEQSNDTVDGEIRRVKKELRLRMTAQVGALPWVRREEESFRVASSVAVHEAWRTARRILFYRALTDELSLKGLEDAAHSSGKIVVLPRAEDNGTLSLWEFGTTEDLEAGYYGIMEPRPTRCRAVSPDQLDMLLVPARAYDRCGNRLGRGKGFYDRLLTVIPPAVPVIGVAFTCQLVDQVPRAAHDRPVQAVVTGKGWHDCRPRF